MGNTHNDANRSQSSIARSEQSEADAAPSGGSSSPTTSSLRRRLSKFHFARREKTTDGPTSSASTIHGSQADVKADGANASKTAAIAAPTAAAAATTTTTTTTNTTGQKNIAITERKRRSTNESFGNQSMTRMVNSPSSASSSLIFERSVMHSDPYAVAQSGAGPALSPSSTITVGQQAGQSLLSSPKMQHGAHILQRSQSSVFAGYPSHYPIEDYTAPVLDATAELFSDESRDLNDVSVISMKESKTAPRLYSQLTSVIDNGSAGSGGHPQPPHIYHAHSYGASQLGMSIPHTAMVPPAPSRRPSQILGQRLENISSPSRKSGSRRRTLGTLDPGVENNSVLPAPVLPPQHARAQQQSRKGTSSPNLKQQLQQHDAALSLASSHSTQTQLRDRDSISFYSFADILNMEKCEGAAHMQSPSTSVVSGSSVQQGSGSSPPLQGVNSVDSASAGSLSVGSGSAGAISDVMMTALIDEELDDEADEDNLIQNIQEVLRDYRLSGREGDRTSAELLNEYEDGDFNADNKSYKSFEDEFEEEENDPLTICSVNQLLKRRTGELRRESTAGSQGAGSSKIVKT